MPEPPRGAKRTPPRPASSITAGTGRRSAAIPRFAASRRAALRVRPQGRSQQEHRAAAIRRVRRLHSYTSRQRRVLHTTPRIA